MIIHHIMLASFVTSSTSGHHYVPRFRIHQLNLSPCLLQRSTEAAGRSLVSIIVDHIFLGIKDAG